MPIITLTSDFGEKDHFVGAIKGAIYSELLEVTLVDVSHAISPFNTLEAAYIVQNAYYAFPKGTIHIIGVDSEWSIENKHIVVYLNEHYFICADNGIMSMITAEIKPKAIFEITIHDKFDNGISGLEVFAKVACHIARGGALNIVGKPLQSIKPIKNLEPYVNEEQTQIIGSVIYIDNYGNVITNVKRTFFETIQKTREFEILARNYKFKTIHNNYNAIVNFNIPEEKRNDEGRGLVVFNSADYLEIAIYKSNSNTVGSAATLMGLAVRNTVTINFIK